jgi:hypothetical protein
MNILPYADICISGLVLAAVVVLLVFRKSRQGADHFAIARQQFAETRVESRDPKYSFAGDTAQVVRELQDTSNGENTSYLLTIYARNSHNEYFVFRSDGDKHNVKHLVHAIAQVVLKDDYQSP